MELIDVVFIGFVFLCLLVSAVIVYWYVDGQTCEYEVSGSMVLPTVNNTYINGSFKGQLYCRDISKILEER